MDATRTCKRRTREEVMTWLQRARERKQAWEIEMQKMLAEEARQRKLAVDSHYYDIK